DGPRVDLGRAGLPVADAGGGRCWPTSTPTCSSSSTSRSTGHPPQLDPDLRGQESARAASLRIGLVGDFFLTPDQGPAASHSQSLPSPEALTSSRPSGLNATE